MNKPKQPKAGSTGQAEEASHPGFGTFKGVFIPSLLSILGVVMYLRLGWVLGHAGLVGTVFIVTLSVAVTFITGLSISMTATNMKVKGGGAYYMISRSLGLEAGAAVGVPLYLAQAFGIAFYLAGFSESLQALFPGLSQILVSCITLIILAAVVYASADIALRIQTGILVIIVLSLVSFFWGTTGASPVPSPSLDPMPKEGFWVVFAVFFPAVTGIEAGIAMSGDLKNPARSLPLGTIAAILISYLVYLAIPLALEGMVSVQALRQDSMIMANVSKFRHILILAIWGASLSSAMGSLLGAPRTMQALARDRVFPRFLGKGYGSEDSPRIATVATFVVAFTGIILGDLNAIAPVLSMFFLTSYGVLNFSAAMEGLIGNPSWRPKFKLPFVIPLCGTLLCLSIMFMINAGATMAAIVASSAIFYLIAKRGIKSQFDDMRVGILVWLARFAVFRLDKLGSNPKSWRPNILVMSGSPTSRWYLIDLVDSMTHGKGFLTISMIIPKKSATEKRKLEVKQSISAYLEKRSVEALVHVSVADDVMDGLQTVIQNVGSGPLVPNTVVLGDTEKPEHFLQFSEVLMKTVYSKRNVLVVRDHTFAKIADDFDEERTRIDIWWGRERQNAPFSLVCAYMLQSSPKWQRSKLNLKTIVKSEEEVQDTRRFLKKYTEGGRIEADCQVYVDGPGKEEFFARIRKESKQADLVFIGMKVPTAQEYKENRDLCLKSFSEYYRGLLLLTQDLPRTVLVVAAEDIKFHHIFQPD